MKFIILDCETSGNTIISLGAVKVIDYVIKDQYYLLIKPDYDPSFIWDKQAEAIHHISEDMLEQTGLPMQIVLETFETFTGKLKGYYLSAWGIYFDLNILKEAYRLLKRNYPFVRREFDIASFVRLYLLTKPNKFHFSLDRCAEELGITNPFPHNALSDAITAAKVFIKVSELIKKGE